MYVHLPHIMPKGSRNVSKLASARQRAGLSQERVAELLGVTHGTVSRAETGFTRPKVDVLKRYAQLYGVHVVDLMEESQPFVMVPVIGRVAAGAWRDAMEQPLDDQELVPYVPRHGRPVPDGALELDGDSMNEIWPEGTLIFFKRVSGAYEPATGQHVVVERRRAGEVEVTCKEVQLMDPKQMLLIPRSMNPAHRPMVVELGGEDDEIRILAVVIDTLQPEPIVGSI